MEELQVYFCDLCNTSVPEADLEVGKALRFRDKVIGSCCLAQLRGGAAAAPRSPRGTFTAALVVLVAIAGSALFLEWRLADEAVAVKSTVGAARAEIQPLDARLVGVERRLAATLGGDALEPLERHVGGLGQELIEIETRIVESVRGNATRIRDLGAQITALDSSQRDHVARIAELRGEIRRVADRVDEMVVAASRAAEPAEAAPASGPDAPVVPGETELPADLARAVAQLEDPDDGTRFEAVDELLQSEDPRVFRHVLPLAKDPDAFVRRLVLEGLKDHKSPESVDALIEALGDTESLVRYTAHASLKELTRQDLPFDPDAAAAKRAAMQRRWQDWWQKNRDSLF